MSDIVRLILHRPRRRQQPEGVQSSNTVQLEIPGVGLTLRTQDNSESNPRSQTQVRGKPPLRRARDRGDRETERILGAIQNNFGVSGMAVTSGR